jgi:predicted neutral ceramidase superfamily lipid hydrolase
MSPFTGSFDNLDSLQNKINKTTYKTDKNAIIFVILLVLFVILLILFVNSLLKQQSTQLPAMKIVISHEIFLLWSRFDRACDQAHSVVQLDVNFIKVNAILPSAQYSVNTRYTGCS